MILDLWGISFHAVVLFGLGKNLLFKSILGRCVEQVKFSKILAQCAISGTKPVAVAVAGRQNVVVKLLHYTNLTVCSGQMLSKNAYVRHVLQNILE